MKFDIKEMFNINRKQKNEEAKLVTFTPRELKEARRIAMQVLAGNAVLIDFTNTKSSLAVRIVDYVSGLLMGIEGDYRKLASKQFLISKSKEISDRFEEEYRNLTHETEV
jgi:cell division inhibitor SepF